jgi:hypothetical protein
MMMTMTSSMVVTPTLWNQQVNNFARQIINAVTFLVVGGRRAGLYFPFNALHNQCR